MLCIVSKYHLQDGKKTKKIKNKIKKRSKKPKTRQKKRSVMLYHTTRCQHLFVHNGLSTSTVVDCLNHEFIHHKES